MNVLILAHDEQRELQLLRVLERPSIQMHSATRDRAIEAIERLQPDVLLTEWTDLCPPLRRHWPNLPMIVLLDASQERQIAPILNAGADDCVLKPFCPAELEARLRAHVRRARGMVLHKVVADRDHLCSSDGYISMCVSSHTTLIGGKRIRLTKIEFELLRHLMTHANKVITHRLLLQRVWGNDYGDEQVYLRTYICQLRHKIEPKPSSPRYILTEPGVGYMFCSL